MPKGVPRARNYKISKPSYTTKAERVKAEEKARRIRAKALSPEEGIAYSIIREFGIDQMQAIGKGTSVDESDYAKRLIQELHDLA